jgi:ABC-type transport system involved in multi-copper enzyme maturation permease subunit
MNAITPVQSNRVLIQLKTIAAVTKAELCKTLKSPMFWITIVGMVFMPMMLGLLMFIKKYPDIAHNSIMLSKATMIPGNGDWASYFGIFAQMISGAGLAVFGFVASWLFGREYSDRTVKDLLALPLPRSSIVIGKFIVLACWCNLLFVIATTVMLGIGNALHLPAWSNQLWLHCMRVLCIATQMNFGLCMLTSFVACMARGYIAPIGFVFVTLILGNFAGMLGFAPYYPWGIPMLYAMKGVEGSFIGLTGIAIVTGTSIVGLIATLLWWRYADQT